ncbi:hypothetical protein GJAV_G00023740 [Gymnothorax javanicus]|nr:hypothetical protein GJAV_G00023740 [Gymnothorax javanicus]
MAKMATADTRPKRFKVWEHFTLNSAKKRITCKLRKGELAYHGSTSVTREHMKRKHVMDDTEAPRWTSGQGTKDGFMQRKQMCTPQQATALTKSVLNMMVIDMRSLSMVDDEEFQQMIRQFNPDYVLPSGTHFTHLMEKK